MPDELAKSAIEGAAGRGDAIYLAVVVVVLCGEWLSTGKKREQHRQGCRCHNGLPSFSNHLGTL